MRGDAAVEQATESRMRFRLRRSRGVRWSVGYRVLRTTVGYCVLRTTVGYCVLRTTAVSYTHLTLPTKA